jgi:hypothetical protein
MALGAENLHAAGGIDSYPVVLARRCLLAGDAGFGAVLATNVREPVGTTATLAPAPGLIQVFVGATNELHLLAWRPRALLRAPLAVVVPVETAHLDAAWRKALLPSVDIGTAPHTLTGLAAFDGEGLKARFEFAWVKAANGDWALDDTKPPRTAKSATALEPIASTGSAAWATSCGRCLRYPLAAKTAAPQLALCRRDCLARATPF